MSNYLAGRLFTSRNLLRRVLQTSNQSKLIKGHGSRNYSDSLCIKINTSKCPRRMPNINSEDRQFNLDLVDFPKTCCVRRSFAKDPCFDPNKNKGKKVKKEEEFKSAWDVPPIRDEFAQEDVLRHDMIFYDDSNKDRLFQKTWIDCPSPLLRRKKQCLSEVKPPQYEKRPKDWKPKTAQCAIDRRNFSEPGAKCDRIGMPCCNLGRFPSKCTAAVKAKDCVKIEAPYPCFSECAKEKPLPLKPKECGCLSTPMICEVNVHIDKFLADMKAQRAKE